MKAVVNVRTGIFSVVCYVFISQFRAQSLQSQSSEQKSRVSKEE